VEKATPSARPLIAIGVRGLIGRDAHALARVDRGRGIAISRLPRVRMENLATRRTRKRFSLAIRSHARLWHVWMVSGETGVIGPHARPNAMVAPVSVQEKLQLWRTNAESLLRAETTKLSSAIRTYLATLLWIANLDLGDLGAHVPKGAMASSDVRGAYPSMGVALVLGARAL